MGFSESQKKMVAYSYCFIPAGDRINAGNGGRHGSGTVYLHFILIF